MSVPAKRLISLFEQMLEEHWKYVWGGARQGTVDCSGAFKYAFSVLDGYNMPFHSSNWMARGFIVGRLRPAREAKPGWAVFKRREESDRTPPRWQDGKGDFYHVGLMGYNGRVLNAKGVQDGFCASPLGEGWDYAAPLKRVEYGGEMEGETVLYKAKVITENDPLNLREAPETGKVLTHVPRGGIVEVIKEGDWCRVNYDGAVGYVSSDFLQKVEELPKPVPRPDPKPVPPAVVKTELYNPDSHQYVTMLGRWIPVNSDD